MDLPNAKILLLDMNIAKNDLPIQISPRKRHADENRMQHNTRTASEPHFPMGTTRQVGVTGVHVDDETPRTLKANCDKRCASFLCTML